MITQAVADGLTIWVDTTAEVAPFRLLAMPLRNKQALVIDLGGAPRLETTPANPPMTSVASADIDGKLDPGGRLDARVRLAFRGDSELLMRTVFRSTAAANWKKLLEELARSEGSGGDVTNLKVSDPAALRDPFVVEFDLALNRFADWSSNKLSVALPLGGAASQVGPEIDAGDSEPMPLGAAPTEVSYRLPLNFPPGVTVRAPLPVEVKRDYATYRTSYSVAGSTLSATRVMTLLASELPAGRRQDRPRSCGSSRSTRSRCWGSRPRRR